MEVELEPRVKPLSYKVKAMSRESPAQKAAHVLDTDLRNHWSTATNTKEWILLELDVPCLLSHIRIYNKSVLEWEISVGLSYKPEAFVKVRPRCEAPRRDMMYPMNYTPCRYVRLSCMRGNPIAIFFIQLIGVPVIGLEPEFQPVANYLLPSIISHKQDAGDMHLQLLQDITSRLAKFLPYFEADLNSFSEGAEPAIRFLAMLSGPFYPILQIANEREAARMAVNVSDYEASKINLPSTSLMVSSNFEPRRSRNTSSSLSTISSHFVFRPDAIFTLLRKAYKDSNLGKLCRLASRILKKLSESTTWREASTLASDVTSSVAEEDLKPEPVAPVSLTDYSNLFGEEFHMPDDHWDLTYLNLLDSEAVEEGILHVLYASASQPLLCSKLAENTADYFLALPLIQALLPALRPVISSPCQIDDSFSLWKQPFVQNALCQIVATSSSLVYRPLLRACAGYLSSFLPSHVKAASVLIDLCSGVLAPCIAQIIAKVDLTLELLEDLLGVIQGARFSLSRARAALKYIVLALSGNMDDVLASYKEAKHQILFLLEMLEPFLDPALTPLKGMIAFGNVSSFFIENQEQNCAIALDVIRAAIRKSAVLSSLEAEWRRGSVAPSVLLAVLDAQLQLPPDIDGRKFSALATQKPQSFTTLPAASCDGIASSRLNSQENGDGKVDDIDISVKVDVPEDVSLLFAPPEVNRMYLTNVPASGDKNISDSSSSNVCSQFNNAVQKNINYFHNDLALTSSHGIELYNLMTNYSHLMNYRDCELRATEFRRLALDLSSQNEITLESHDAAIDALLLAAECYINPYFMKSFKEISVGVGNIHNKRTSENCGLADINSIFPPKNNDLKLVADLERKRDRFVLEILIAAAELDRKYCKVALEGDISTSDVEEDEDIINMNQQDIFNADAITLVRQNQAMLCNFLVRRLQRNSDWEQYYMHEILMWCLLFLLHSATKLFCSPEHVVDIILNFAESFEGQLKSFESEGNSQLKSSKLHEVQCRWILLNRLVIASSGNDESYELSINAKSGFRFSNLIPASAWLQKVPAFASSARPLVRYFGWMAVSRNAKQYLKERLFLVSDLSQITYILSIFSDDLSLVDNIIEQKSGHESIERLGIHQDNNMVDRGRSHGYQDAQQSFHALYPGICKLFPNLKKEFEAFGETILEAVGLQLKFLSSALVPDLMCWFSSLCSWPFVQSQKPQDLFQSESVYFKGFVAKNAKAVILFILEAIVVEHMEAMVPEIPKVVQVLVSLCRTSYSDVSFLDSILRLLKPIIAYSLNKVSDEEKLLVDVSFNNFESLCFGQLFNNIRQRDESSDSPKDVGKCKALTIFVLATIFGNLSFHGKAEVLQSAILWADFTSFEGTTAFHDYICAYQALMENCKDLLIGTSRIWGIIPLKMSACTNSTFDSDEGFPKSRSGFLSDMFYSASPTDSERHQDNNSADADASQRIFQLDLEEIRSITKNLEALVSKLNPTTEQCWKIHHKLAKKLALTSAECFMYSKCLFFIADRASASSEMEKLLQSKFVDEFPGFWNTSLEGLSRMILVLQENLCWEVASVLLESLLGVPLFFHLDNVIRDIFSAVKNFSDSAPNIIWRLQTDKMISLILARGIHNLCQIEMPIPLFDLFCSLLGHPEPEQRYIALKHLGRLVGQDANGERWFLSLTTETLTGSSNLPLSDYEPKLSALVSSTWDQVVLLASSDSSLLLRTHATALLIYFIPYVERSKLQSFLAAAESILQCLTTLAQPSCYGPLTQFSLALIASVCLFSPVEDISLIPECIWRNIETFGMSGNGRYCTDLEKKACEALCRLKDDGDQAKEILKNVLSSSSPKQMPDFVTTRESILQVIGNLSSAQSYFDFFSNEVEQKAMELEEAEMEMELIRTERPVPDSSIDFQDWRQLPFLSTYAKNDDRLQQIKDGIRSLEKTKVREDIVARRQRKLLLRLSRQNFLEEAALRESELIQKFDRERTIEVEKELQRQQVLELERAKTRELRHNLDIEKEKLAQRELQRELEQLETGMRSSRREFASSSHSRQRDRYRERDNLPEGNEGNLRTSVRTVQQDAITSNTSMGNQPTVVLSGARPFAGQLPTILQSRERSDDCGSSYEDNIDGRSKDSGDTGSVGDPDTVSALEGQSTGFPSAQRHGSRGSKSRQIVDRRERDARREGKWERKH
ncbi:uncharacterized protein [Primulina eburnea]|uniref:uncharacterized protein isoform X1 n=1 Tax=Primulina eburnea TaxID=1245227 RepID=UPI003C6BF821